MVFHQIPLNCSYKKNKAMTLKLYTAAAGIALFALVSCGGNNKPDYVDQSLITPGSEKKDTVPAVINQPGTVMPSTVPTNIPGISTVNPGVSASPVSVMPQNNTMQITPATTTAATITAPGMNPPHGEPGHRCDITVGAPLNSKPAPANVQPTTVSAQPTTVSAQPNPVTVKEVPNPTKTAPGMNPPHGEPGHKCEIAVGAPLDSKPTITTPAPAPTNAPPLIMAPVKKDNK